LGAFNDMNYTKIRYSHIQVRRLPGNSGMLGSSRTGIPEQID
jgi:hypothetical protein